MDSAVSGQYGLALQLGLMLTRCVTLPRSDIEQEVNGVYSFDRKAKIDPTRVKALFDRAAKKYLDGHSTYASVSEISTGGDASEAALPTGVAKPA